MEQQLNLISGINNGRLNLIGPLRDKVAHAQSAAMDALQAMPDVAHGTITFDYCETCIEQLTYIHDAHHDVRKAISDAVHRRNGYDTWPKADLEAMINGMQLLREAIHTLEIALNHLAACEQQEMHSLRLCVSA